jgi:hypothetical protein
MSECHQVFISYSHETPEHKQAVLGLAGRLRQEGVDAWLDQYEPAPPEGWPRWMEQQIEGAKFVLLVCTEIYHDRVKMRAEQGKGLGALWEGNLIYQLLYEAGTINNKFIPLLPPGGKAENIPGPLRGSQRYAPFSETGYTDLYRHLTGQAAVSIPRLGPQKKLPPHMMPAASLPQQSINTIVCTTSQRAVVMMPDEKALAFLPVVSSQWNNTEAHFLFEPDADDHEAARLLSSFRGQRQNIYVAYKNNAGIAYAEQVEQVTGGGRERWKVDFQLTKIDFSQVMEFNSPSLTADQAAVLRAKRVLLNEGQSEQLNGNPEKMMTELQIAGQGTILSVKGSAFPAFLRPPENRDNDHLEAAWIYAVLQLKLSAAIEHVSRLELTLQGDKIGVNFSGRRYKKYSNQSAFQIEFSGICPLG